MPTRTSQDTGHFFVTWICKSDEHSKCDGFGSLSGIVCTCDCHLALHKFLASGE